MLAPTKNIQNTVLIMNTNFSIYLVCIHDFIFHLGDFGISKVMSTRGKEAHTVLGTPYYISPEMCEGKGYDEKSDIWALGCIVYEMACLQKTFEGSNLPGTYYCF